MIAFKQAIVFLGLAVAAAIAVSAATMSVQVKEAAVRATPSFVGKVVGSAAYGDRVEVQQSHGSWMRISAPEITGWVHNSALSSKRIVLSAGQEQAKVSASGDELALAGKGFNSDVEAQFKARNRNVDFAWVDRMERTRVSPEEMRDFLQKGGLKSAGGETK